MSHGKVEDSTLVFHKNFERHHFFKYCGFGLNLNELVAAKRQGITQVRLIIGGAMRDLTWDDIREGVRYTNPKPPGDRQVIITCATLGLDH
jgi:hypothetical protein